MKNQDGQRHMRRSRQAPELPRLLSVGEVAEVFGRGPKWVRTRVQKGELEAFRDKGGLMIVKASVQEYLERCRLVVVRPPPATAPEVKQESQQDGSQAGPGTAAGSGPA
jgi:hypothetical protein